jgi:hypothetical protein
MRQAEAATPPALDAHEAEYTDDGGDGYLACRCGYGHVLGEDALVDHIHGARLSASGESPDD